MDYQSLLACEKKVRGIIGDFLPETGVVLGSGLGPFADEIEAEYAIPYAEVGIPASTVQSHEGKLIFGRVAGRRVVAQKGRLHFYEGYELEQVVLPVRLMARLGARNLVVTNASGGVNQGFEVGDIMLITDQIKFFDVSPLRGPNPDELGGRFPDMSYAYDRGLRALARVAANDCGTELREGVYFYMPGPQFESPAEIRAIRALGGDAVGMSTVHEVIAAVHCGLRVLGFSLITNMAAGVLDQKLSDEDVVEAAKLAGSRFSKLMTRVIGAM